MDVLGDLVNPDRGNEALWYHRPGPRSRSWSGEQFCVDAWKAGNLLRHYGVHEGATVGVLDGPDEPTDRDDRTEAPSPQALIAAFGGWILGASVQFDLPPDPDVRALVGPTDWLDDYELPPGSKRLAFGRDPDGPTVAHFESERWSENPIKFPAQVGAEDLALTTPEATMSHQQMLDAADEVVETHGIEAGDRIALEASLADPGAVVAGVIAPLVAGATITVGEDARLTVGDGDGENVIQPGSARP